MSAPGAASAEHVNGPVQPPPPHPAADNMNRVSVVMGTQWGDEGKGKLVDLLATDVDVVCRCQGGNNAGHTVVIDGVKYDFHLLPSGIVNPQCKSLIGNGVVIHLPGLFDELAKLPGIEWRHRLLISSRAHLVFDVHQAVDGMQEDERARGSTDSTIGTTKKGIGPTYATKAGRSSIRVCDLVGDFDSFCEKYRNLHKQLLRSFTSLQSDAEGELRVYREYAERIRDVVVDGVAYLHQQLASGKRVLVEGANAAMLDIDFGTYPYVTSSNCTIGGVCTGLGIPPCRVGPVYGVVKAYCTRVGKGPFPTELTGEVGAYLQEQGGEWGTTTKRKRRCGWLDVVQLRYTHLINHYTALCITKLDVLDELDQVKVGVAYKLDSSPVALDYYPASAAELERVTVQYETYPGWKSSTAQCRHLRELPENARAYIKGIEALVGVPVRWVGVGQDRNSMVYCD